jgi:hypothetical protein
MEVHESWIDRQIREAQERGEFDNLPGAGKPIKGLGGRQDPDWWAKGLIERERLPMPLPPALALRKEVEALPSVIGKERSEANARAIVEDLNARILDHRRRIDSGPPIFVRTVDVDATLELWRRDRAQRDGQRRAELEDLRRSRRGKS